MPHICGIEILGMPSPIGENLPHQGLVLEDHYHTIARVNDFPGKRLQHDSRDSRRDTPLGWVWASVRISLGVLHVALLEHSFCPRLQWRVLLREKASMILGYEPNSRKVRPGGGSPGFCLSRVLCRLGKNYGRESQRRRRENQSHEMISDHEPPRMDQSSAPARTGNLRRSPLQIDWVADKLTRCRVLVGQALLPVRVCCGGIVPDRQECLSYLAT